jgi:GT2 family glycosyltransferase
MLTSATAAGASRHKNDDHTSAPRVPRDKEADYTPDMATYRREFLREQTGASSMHVSVIICAHTAERWQILSRAVQSVRDQTMAPREIILVIDGNEELLRRCEAELEGTIVVANRHPGGLSGGRRTGAEEASAPLLAFLDDDAIADPVWLSEFAVAYNDPQVLGVGGRVDPLWEHAPPHWLPAELYWVIGCTYAGMPETGGRIRNPIGANMSIRADVLKRTGHFAAALGRSNRGKRVSGTADETEFSIRAVRAYPDGYWAYRPRARVRHAVPASRTTWRYFVARCRLEGTAKAILTGLTGRREGLASERDYIRSVLPRALVRELRTAGHGRWEGLLCAGAIVAGVAITAFTYLEQVARLCFARPTS